MADIFAKFEAVWQAVWAYIYKVLDHFDVNIFKAEDAE